VTAVWGLISHVSSPDQMRVWLHRTKQFGGQNCLAWKVVPLPYYFGTALPKTPKSAALYI